MLSSPSRSLIRSARRAFYFVIPLAVNAAFSQAIQNDQIPPGKLFGDISAALNDVEHGLTQTDKSPSLKAGFGYKWTQFKLGLYGKNVRYTDSDDSVVFSFFPSYRFIFTSKWDLTASYQFRRSYKSGDHNDGLWNLDSEIFDYHLEFQIDDQWEGTGTQASRIAVWRDLPLGTNKVLFWHLEGGYNLTSTTRTNKYFDFKTSLIYHTGDIQLSLVGTDSTANGDFKSRGSAQIYLQLAVLL